MPVQQMRVGTLDTLMSLSDELARVDSAVESVVKKVERQVAESYNALKTQELLAKRRPDDETPINVPALGLRVAGKPVADYVTKFKWDSNTWDPREPLPELVKRISTASERIDADMRQYATAYQEKKTALQAAERKRRQVLWRRGRCFCRTIGRCLCFISMTSGSVSGSTYPAPSASKHLTSPRPPQWQLDGCLFR